MSLERMTWRFVSGRSLIRMNACQYDLLRRAIFPVAGFAIACSNRTSGAIFEVDLEAGEVLHGCATTHDTGH